MLPARTSSGVHKWIPYGVCALATHCWLYRMYFMITTGWHTYCMYIYMVIKFDPTTPHNLQIPNSISTPQFLSCHPSPSSLGVLRPLAGPFCTVKWLREEHFAREDGNRWGRKSAGLDGGTLMYLLSNWITYKEQGQCGSQVYTVFVWFVINLSSPSVGQQTVMFKMKVA